MSKLAKFWQDSGMWEFYDPSDEFAIEQMKQGRCHFVDDEIAAEYEALVAKLDALGKKIREQG